MGKLRRADELTHILSMINNMLMRLMIVIEVLSTPGDDSERDWQKPISDDDINVNTGGGGV